MNLILSLLSASIALSCGETKCMHGKQTVKASQIDRLHVTANLFQNRIYDILHMSNTSRELVELKNSKWSEAVIELLNGISRIDTDLRVHALKATANHLYKIERSQVKM